jgi:hypothetical protein
LFTIFVVSTAADSGAGSLRAAMQAANSHANVAGDIDHVAVDVVALDAAGGDRKIELLTALPAITDPVILGERYVATPTPTVAEPTSPQLELDGTSAGAATIGLDVAAGGTGSTLMGVAVNRFGSHGIRLQSNLNGVADTVYVGTDRAGTAVLGNGGNGITITGSNNVVTLAKVVNNAGDGVAVLSGTGNWILGQTSASAIHSNGGQAIDLGTDGVTPNDAGDPDSGPNNLQNTPVLSSVSFAGGNATVSGTINTTPNALIGLDFFTTPLAKREGRQYVTSDVVTADASGNASFSVLLSGVSAGNYITATATSLDTTDTSEFSNPVGALPAWLGAGSAATWDPETKVLTVTGAASIVADPASDAPVINAGSAAAVLTVNPATVADNDVHIGALHLSGGAVATVTSAGAGRTATNHRVLVVESGDITVTGTSKLNLTDNDMIVKHAAGQGAAKLAAIEGLVKSGLNFANNGFWDGPGVNSSKAAADPAFNKALGVISNDLAVDTNGQFTGAFYGNFAGVPVDQNAVLVKYTWFGDADLSGSIDGTDYGLIDAGFLSNGSLGGWFNGDFDYSDTIDGTDYGLIDGAFLTQDGTTL